MAGLFTTLNISTRGMSVQQKAIDVTSHNISNANTEGYSRQKAVIETTTPYTMPATNAATGAGQLGTGAQVSAIERYRDSFIDYQIRTQTSTKGQYDTRQTQLGEIESIFNEPSDTGLSTMMSNFFSAWQELSKQPNSSNARTVVAQQSSALADDLNSKYTQLVKLKENTQLETKNSIVDINSQLSQITTLNQQIIETSVSGNKANDLMDKRDLLLDGLSSKFNINISNTKLDGINLSPVDTSGVASPNMVSAQQNGTDKRLSYISDITSTETAPGSGVYTATVTYYALGDMSNAANKHTLSLTGLSAQQVKDIDENRTIWADSKGVAVDSTGTELSDSPSTYPASSLMLFQPSDGEMKGYTSVQQDIDSYIDQLNNVAKVLAFSVNAVHSGLTDPGAAVTNLTATTSPLNYDGMPFFVNSDVAQYDANSAMTNLVITPPATQSILSAEKNITAGNISVNKQILKDVTQIKTRTNDNQYATESGNTVDGEADGTRAAAIADLANVLFKVSDVGSNINQRSDLFAAGENTMTNNGMTVSNNTSGTTVSGYFKDTIDKLGIQSQEAQRMVTNQDTLLTNFTTSKASVSGVSLDEEMANLIQYQHAYQANAKVISTIDSLMDVVINGLKK